MGPKWNKERHNVTQPAMLLSSSSLPPRPNFFFSRKFWEYDQQILICFIYLSKTSHVKKKKDFDAAKLLDFINNGPGHLWDLQFDMFTPLERQMYSANRKRISWSMTVAKEARKLK